MVSDSGAISQPESWRAVPGYEGFYEVSDLGQVRSLHARWNGPKTLAQKLDECGYPEVCLCVDSKPRNVCVHRLVALAFHGEKRNILHREVAHLDGLKTNNAAANLKWVSHAENMSHKRKHGTGRGERHPRAKLTEDAVREIRLSDQSLGALAARYGVSPYTVSDVRRGKRWRHVQCSNRG